MSRMDELIEEINHLAHKAKTIGLSAEEEEKRAALRKEYIALFREGFKKNYLDNMYYVDEKGNEEKIEKKKQGGNDMKKETLDFITAKSKELLTIPNACKEAKAAAEEWLKNAENDIENKTKEYIAALEEEIASIEGSIAFASSDMGKKILGEGAEPFLKDALARKERGEKYCGCPACSCFESIIKMKDKL